MRLRSTLLGAALAAGLLLTAGTAGATIINLVANMDGAQAAAGAGTGSPATGTATITFDTDTNLLSWSISWTGLVNTPTLMHFHGPALPNQNAGVTVGVGVASNPAVGSATITSTQATQLLGGLWYVNLHTNVFPAGEIRGQVTVIPEPTALLLVGLGLVGLAGLRRSAG